MTIEELRKIADSEREARQKFPHHVCVCMAAGCQSSGAAEVLDALRKEVVESGMRNEVQVKGVGCMGLCSAGPLVAVETEGRMYAHLTPGDAPEVIRGLDTGADGDGLQELSAADPFFRRQKRIVLENSGLIDPERIEDYIAQEGYFALVHAITELTPLEVVQ
jgi:bidirectional [NiFe] hydrogenase diaphorase subunit